MDRSAAAANGSAPKNRKHSAKATLQAEEKKSDANARSKLEHVLIWLKRLAIASFVAGVVAVVALLFYVRSLEADLPSIAQLQGNYHPPQVTRILARDGSLLAEAFTERRTVVPLSELPPHVKLAVLAAEDANFYEHEGLNYWGIARAMLVNLRAGHTRQGGSTITQQVAKNFLLTNQVSLMTQMNDALSAFYAYTVAAGVASNVTTFTMSDFNRTFIGNANIGTDHAYGGHHFVMGGAVKGGKVYGTFPSLVVKGVDDVSNNGAWLPTTSVDQVGATLASWFGVNGSDLDYVFPNLPNFTTQNLGFV